MLHQLREFMTKERPDTNNVNEIKMIFNTHPATTKQYTHNKSLTTDLRALGFTTKRTGGGIIINDFLPKKKLRFIDRIDPSEKNIIIRINDIDEKLDKIINLLNIKQGSRLQQDRLDESFEESYDATSYSENSE